MGEGKGAGKPNDANQASVELPPFALAQMFPDPQALFDTKYRSLEEIKEECLVALDANVLLMPYVLGTVSLAEAVAVYRPLAEAQRLIIPAQAAREFGKHRSRKIADVVKHLQDQVSKVAPPLSKHIGFLADDGDFQAAKKVSDQIGKLAKDLQKHVRKMVSRISSELGNDPVSNAYRDLFKGCVRGKDEPANQVAFDKELGERYAVKRPPGYKDGSKPDRGAGDLLIWHTILKAGSESSKDCIFVTADEKADWYLQSAGAFQPRLELVEEYRTKTDGKTLHIVPLSRLLELYGAEEKAVAEARQIENTDSAAAMESRRLSAPDPGDEEWLSILSELDDVERRLQDTNEAISRFGADQFNTSLSLPWNRALHATRIEQQGLIQRREKLRRRLIEIEPDDQP